MTNVFPRLDRVTALEITGDARDRPLTELAEGLPNTSVTVTFSPVGGQRVDDQTLRSVRAAILEIARDHGFPEPFRDARVFESRCARILHDQLAMTPHEAAQEAVWSYLTCCWLLDIAYWRYPDGNPERFYGHLNRNTFRRLWWRAEVLGPEVDLALLGEDELVNIMERPTLFADHRLARAIALEHIARATADGRMLLMREATKRLLRLTPFVSFDSLTDSEIRENVGYAFDVSAAGLQGVEQRMPILRGSEGPEASPEVTALPSFEIAAPTSEPAESLSDSARFSRFDEVADVALSIARSTGRVTNLSLREGVPVITAEEARDIFRVLMDRGQLVRRGVKRGTYYTIPEQAENVQEMSPPPPSVVRTGGSSDTALRRLLKRLT